MSSTPESSPVIVTAEPDDLRYVATIDGEVAGIAEYRLRDGRHVFHHTEVGDAFGGRGVGSTLIRGALDDVESKGALVVPLCPFVGSFIDKHPEFQWLVDVEMTERLHAE